MPRALKIIFGATLFGQVVFAQPAPPPATTEGQGAPPAAPPPDADIGVKQRATLSPQDMINQAKIYRQRMDATQTRVQGQVEQARKSKDIIRVNCLLDKLTQIKANLNIVDSAIVSLQDATARRDEGAGLHEYTRITIINQKVEILAAEAEACVGEDLTYVGATRIDVESEGVPPGDFTEPGLAPPTFDRPPAASPTQ